MAVTQTQATGVVSAINFDYRGFDTVGEEFILFAAAAGVSVVLRRLRGERERSALDEAADRDVPSTSGAVRMVALLFTGPVVLAGVVAGVARPRRARPAGSRAGWRAVVPRPPPGARPGRHRHGRGRAVMLFVLMIRTADRDQVYWFAGFRPARGIVIGIDFEVQPLSNGLACLAAVLAVAAMTFSWRYFEGVATYYHALMLIFLAGITGFCLTGDIFDLFVWFELMGVAAYALTAYRPEERGPLQGALNFAITNSVGAYLSLSGIALIYGRTGALNMAQIGTAIARHPADRLVVVAFLLIIAALLIKGAIVPFHFWLADAHAVAPTPVCVLFSGVMVELGPVRDRAGVLVDVRPARSATGPPSATSSSRSACSRR